MGAVLMQRCPYSLAFAACRYEVGVLQRHVRSYTTMALAHADLKNLQRMHGGSIHMEMPQQMQR